MPNLDSTLLTSCVTNSIQAALFGDADVVLITEPINTSAIEIYPEEQQYIKNAAQARVAEFSAGRSCAKKALTQLGITNFPLHVGKERQPVWPNTIVGSISHCKSHVGVAVAEKNHFASIGLDIETIKPLRYNISSHVCTSKERQWLSQLSKEQHELMLILIFSLKEAIYKAVYAHTHIKLAFKDVTVIPNIGNNIVQPVFHNHAALTAGIEKILLRFYINSSHVYSSAVILRNIDTLRHNK